MCKKYAHLIKINNFPSFPQLLAAASVTISHVRACGWVWVWVRWAIRIYETFTVYIYVKYMRMSSLQKSSFAPQPHIEYSLISSKMCKRVFVLQCFICERNRSTPQSTRSRETSKKLSTFFMHTNARTADIIILIYLITSTCTQRTEHVRVGYK